MVEIGPQFAIWINPIDTYLWRVNVVKRKAISGELLEVMAEKFRMLSDPTRLAILHALMESEQMNVSELVIATKRSVANVSKHLKLLTDAGLLSREKKGPFVLYQLRDPITAKICKLVCDSMQVDFQVHVKRTRGS